MLNGTTHDNKKEKSASQGGSLPPSDSEPGFAQ